MDYLFILKRKSLYIIQVETFLIIHQEKMIPWILECHYDVNISNICHIMSLGKGIDFVICMLSQHKFNENDYNFDACEGFRD